MEIIGNGTISEVKPGKIYRIRHNVGKDPATGAYLKSPWRTVYCTKRQARDELAKYKQELIEQDELAHAPQKMPMPTIREYADSYLNQRMTNRQLAKATISRNTCDCAHVVKLFGDFKLDEITPDIINARCSAYRLAEGMSLNVIYRVAKFLKTLYRRAVIDGLIPYGRNPCLGINIDKPEPSDRRSLTVDEFKRLNEIVETHELDSCVVAVKIGIATGMRRGEVLGLQWSAVDLDACKIKVVQQCIKNKVIKKPKSRSGIRTLCIDQSTVTYLKRWREKQAILLRENGTEQALDSPVISSGDGGFIDPTCFLRWFQGFCVENGFGEYKVVEEYRDGQGKNGGWKRTRRKGYEGLCFHELRHTQATLLIGSRCDIKTVQHRLGHADVQTTLNIYAHAIDANDKAAAETIAALQL